MQSNEGRTQQGNVLFMDVYEGRNYFVQDVASRQADAEIRMAIFHAIHGRCADQKNMDDALAC